MVLTIHSTSHIVKLWMTDHEDLNVLASFKFKIKKWYLDVCLDRYWWSFQSFRQLLNGKNDPFIAGLFDAAARKS